MIKKRYVRMAGGLILLFGLAGLVGAKEPNPPNVNKTLSHIKEQRISQMETSSVQQCFEQLKAYEFYLDDDFSIKAAYKCFKNRKAQALRYAIDQLKNDQSKHEGEIVIFNDDLHATKTISRVFAEDAEIMLQNEYKKGTAQTKANILLVLGQLTGNRARYMLIDALNDQTVCEDTYPEIGGEPLRICDMAYNQLRLRYAEELVDMPRTIGNSDRIEKRDFYIDDMKRRL